MIPTLARCSELLWAVLHELREERITFMAGSLAYNAFVSLLPLLVLLLFVATEVGNQRLETSLLALTNAVATPGAGEVLVSEVHAVSTEVSILGGALLVWGALRIFRTLDSAFSEVYETTARNTLLNQLFDGITVFVSLAAVVFVASFLQSQAGIVGGASAGWMAQRLILVLGVAVALFPMYYLFPDETNMGALETLPGLCFSALGLVTFESLFQVYLQVSSTAARESILASILVFLTWLYFTGLILLIGAAINAVFSNRSENVNVQPVLGGIPMAERSNTRSVDGRSLARAGQLAAETPLDGELSIATDEGSVSLPAPKDVTTDTKISQLPLVNNTVGIRLVWDRTDTDVTDEEVHTVDGQQGRR